jgi:predicted peptidase
MTTTVDDDLRGAMIYVPPNYDPAQAWPLVVFLHGAGERGRDGVKQTKVGLPPVIQKYPERFPCLVLMPQCAAGDLWSSETAKAHIDDAIAQTLAAYNVDESRISLTGLSLGGFGSFAYGAENANMFCAIMPVCGGGDSNDKSAVAKLATIPIRVFHGADDRVVPAKRSREMVAAIRGAGGDIQYTEYPDTSHNSWDQAYGDPEAIAWLLAQRSE